MNQNEEIYATLGGGVNPKFFWNISSAVTFKLLLKCI